MAIPRLSDYALPTVDQFPSNKLHWQLQPQRAVLLLHDVQQYFLEFYHPASALIRHVLANCVAVRRWCKAHGIPVVYTAQPSEQSPQQRGLLNDVWGPGITAADPDAQRIVPELTPEADDVVLTKWRYSAFQRSPLQSQMQEWGRDQLLICGVYAHIGCLISAADAFMRDIQPFMVGDALADFSAEEHAMALRYVAGRCGYVLSTQQVLHSTQAALSRDWLQKQLLELLPVSAEEFDPEESLIDYGLDSLRVMLKLSEWQALGIQLSFEQLARQPTLNAWWQLIEPQLGRA